MWKQKESWQSDTDFVLGIKDRRREREQRRHEGGGREAGMAA